MKKISSLIYIIPLLFVFISCEKSITEPENTGINTVDNLEIISNENVNNVVLGYNPESGVFQFKDNNLGKANRTSDFVENNPGNGIFETGDYLIIPPSTYVPSGCLKKITSVIDEGSTLSITTIPAHLDEVVDGSFEGSYDYSVNDIDSVFVYEKGLRKAYIDYDYFTLPIDYEFKPFPDKDDYLEVTGLINISFGIDFGLDSNIEMGLPPKYNVNRFELAFRVDNINNLKVKYFGNLNDVELPSIKVAEYKLKPIRFAIGPVPVWITNTVPVSLDFSKYFSDKDSLSIEVGKNLTYRIGVRYQNSETSLINEFSISKEPSIKINGPGYNCSMKTSLEVDLLSKIYDVAGVHVGVEGYGLINLNSIKDSNPQSFDIDKAFGLVGHVGADVEFASIRLFKYDKDFLIWEKYF